MGYTHRENQNNTQRVYFPRQFRIFFARWEYLASGSDDKTILLWDVSPVPTPYPGDFDDDLNVDFADFLAFVGVFGLSSSDANYDARMDMNGDGIINFSDFLIFTIIFGTTYS